MAISTMLTKTIGLGSAIIVGSDIVRNAQRRSEQRTANNNAEELTELFIKSDSAGNSQFANDLNNKYFDFRLDNQLSNFFNMIRGKVQAYGNELFMSGVPLLLSIGALCTKTNVNKSILKGCVPKPIGIACAGVLGLMGVKTLCMDVLGIE